MTDEEKQEEIRALSAEVESIIKYSHIPARNGNKPKTFVNIGAATSAVRARCRKILELRGEEGPFVNKTTELMKLAGIDLG